MADQDFITFGPVHLEVIDPERTARFWQEVAGFERRASGGGSIEVGATDETLLVLHCGARSPYLQGHSGLYRVAVHAPNERDFARMLKRFAVLRYAVSPTDHTFSKTIYLDYPNGINIEFTLETQERFSGVKPGSAFDLSLSGPMESNGLAPLHWTSKKCSKTMNLVLRKSPQGGERRLDTFICMLRAF